MSLKSEAWPRPACAQIAFRLPSNCVPTASRRLSSVRVVVPCLRCPALNKLA